MTERDELPEGWNMHRFQYRARQYFALRDDPWRRTGACATEQAAIAAAWRIVDAEKEAADGR